jgi:hypothetical protein
MSQTQTQAPAQSGGQPDQIVFTDAFKNAVRDYCEKDDQCIKLKKELKDVKDELKGLEDTIVKFMNDNNLPIFDTGEKGMFKSSTKKEKKGLSKQIIIDALSKCEHLKDPLKAEEVATFIYNSRPEQSKTILTRK